MRYHTFEEAQSYNIALLIKASSFNKQALQTTYVTPWNAAGIPSTDIIAFDLTYASTNKVSVKIIKEYLAELLPVLQDLQTEYLYVADANYFKVLTNQARADPHIGYVLPCVIKGFEHFKVILGINYQALIYNPALQAKLDMTLDTVVASKNGTYQTIGTGIIHSASYPEGPAAIAEALNKLHAYPRLTCDIETFSLLFNEAGIGTIAFAWDRHNGIAFACDWISSREHPNPCVGIDAVVSPGAFLINQKVRDLLREFFQTYQGELVFHKAAFDVKIMIHELFMQDLQDTAGLLAGLEVMTRSYQDTKIIAYLALNSTAGNILGLKHLAHEFAGNWAIDEIKDIRKVPLPELLQYNLVDALSTFYVFDKYYPIMVQDKQEELYLNLMMPSQTMLLQMELTGMPMSRQKIADTRIKLDAIRQMHLYIICNSPIIKTMDLLAQRNAMDSANAKLKVKQHPIEKFSDVTFNPNSGPQLQTLLYEQMGLPVIDYTDSKQPATGVDTIAKLIHHVQDPSYKVLLESLIAYGKVSKILTTFIPAFERAIAKGDPDIVWLHGNMNLGGTVSGRLSSSEPNLTNIPASGEDGKYGKVIKECFVAPKGWIFAGADFNSLEDYISALTTKDPNKLKVYIDGFDGHCLRAAYYFKDKCPDIDVTSVTSVNSMKKSYPALRQESKTPTFALTYGGTHHTLMANLGWPKDKAQAIEANYHEMYAVSDAYIQDRLMQASKDGYVEVAFGLRVRTPLLKQVVFNARGMPYEAAAEGRTAGNAMGQSYGLLNTRAAVDFMQKVWKSPYRLDILPVALIHDAIYILIRDDIAVVEWANRELILSMQWQELPEIQHPTVKLGAALDLFWPDWAHPITLPNNADQATIRSLCEAARQGI